MLDDTGPMPPCSVERPQDCVVVRGDGPHIALVGDSQARMLGPMFIKLAQEHDLTLSLNVMPACSWQAGLVNVTQPLENQRKCRSLRAEWYDEALPVLDPDLVVLAAPRDDEAEWAGNLVRDGGSDETLSELNFAATTETLDTITSQGRRALVVTSMLGTPGWTAGLPGHRDPARPVRGARACRDAGERRLLPDRLGTLGGRVHPRREPDHLRGRPRLPVVDDIVVWKNRNHFTTMIATHFRREVWSAPGRRGRRRASRPAQAAPGLPAHRHLHLEPLPGLGRDPVAGAHPGGPGRAVEVQVGQAEPALPRPLGHPDGLHAGVRGGVRTPGQPPLARDDQPVRRAGRHVPPATGAAHRASRGAGCNVACATSSSASTWRARKATAARCPTGSTVDGAGPSSSDESP